MPPLGFGFLADSTDEHAGLMRDALEKAGEQVLRAGQVIQRLREFIARGETEKRIESSTVAISPSERLDAPAIETEAYARLATDINRAIRPRSAT
jgi:two-component system sensor kinase FixL